MHDEIPTQCLFAGNDVEWKPLEEYLDEMKKLKKALDDASKIIDTLEEITKDK